MKCRYCSDPIGVGDGVESIPRYKYGSIDVCDHYCSEECRNAHEQSRWRQAADDYELEESDG
jgi:hypothetical protein